MTTSTLLENTLYINLEERKDRLEHLIIELNKLNISNPIRIDAIKLPIGSIGCTLSHIKALEYALKTNMKQVFICEDDITFLNPELLVENLDKFNKKVEDWDVIIIGGNNCPPYKIIENFYCRIYNCQTTTGYIVNSHYYATLINNFKTGLTHLMREPNKHNYYAIDIYWKQLQRIHKWYMIIPPSVIQYENYSDIEKRFVNYDGLMLDMEKPWLKI